MNDKVATPKLIGRMRKLLELAEHATDGAGTQAEIEAAKMEADRARARVFELMAEYDVSREYIDAIEAAGDELKEHKRYEIRKPFVQKGRLMHILAQQAHVIVILGSKPKTTVQFINAYGFKQDMERFGMVWSSVLAQGEREYALTRIPPGVHPPTFKRGWWESFTVAIFRRITAEKQKAYSTINEGTEIVLRDRDQEVKDFVEGKVGPTRKGRRSATRLRHGSREGYAAGMKVNLGDSGIGTNERAGIGR